MAQGDNIYKTRDEALADVLGDWASRIPDIGLSTDTIVYIWSWVFAGTASNLFLGLQLLHDDIFIQTMGQLALLREGEEIGRPQKTGTLATGTVTFRGAGGTAIESGSQVGAPQPFLDQTLVFETTDDVLIPDPGTPTAPTIADGGVAGNPSGTLEYGITFVTAGGETAIGAASAPLSVVSRKVNVTNIPLGGSGTTSRKIYRSLNGGVFKFVATLADNTTTIYLDNITDGALGGVPPTESTAETVDAPVQATETGVEYNVGVGAINVLVSVDGDVTSVTNAAMLSGGEDPEAIEKFRQELLKWKQNPQSGSSNDLVAWATSIDGIDTAAVFKNVDLAGSPELGSVVVRVSGPDGTVPDGDLLDEVQAYLDSKDLANITIYVGTFDALPVNVTVHVAPLPGYVLADIDDSVSAAIAAYVNGVPTGGVVYMAGIYHAAYGLAGVRTLIVNAPSSDVEAAADEKPTIGTVTIAEEPWS